MKELTKEWKRDDLLARRAAYVASREAAAAQVLQEDSEDAARAEERRLKREQRAQAMAQARQLFLLNCVVAILGKDENKA